MSRSRLGAVRRGLATLVGSVISFFLRLSAKQNRLYWPYVTEALSMVPFAFGYQLRQVVYERSGGGCGEGTIIHHGTTIEDRRTRFGKDIWISAKVYIDYALIEDHVLIGPEAVILAGRNQHNSDRLDIPIKLQGNPPKDPIYIHEGAWIGANATVMADVGRHAIVGAGSVVIEPVPDYAVVVGNPARIIKDRRQTGNQFLAKEA